MEFTLKDLIRQNPESFEANHKLGELYIRRERLEEAIPYLERAYRINSSHYVNGYDLALAYLKTNNLRSAKKQILDMIRRNETAELHNLFGHVEEALGNRVEAATAYQRAAHMDPSEQHLFDWGSDLLRHRAIEPSLEVYRHGVERHPISTRMQIGLGVALYARGLYDDAVKTLCTAADVEPSDPRPYLFLGRMQDVSPAMIDEVAQRLERFVRVDPRNPLAHYYYALILWKADPQNALGEKRTLIESHLQKVIQFDGRFAEAHLQLGILHAEQKKMPEAIREYKKAIRLQPDLAKARYRLAQAFMQIGEKTRAKEQFKIYERLHKQQMAESDRREAEVGQLIYSIDRPAEESTSGKPIRLRQP